MQSGKIDWADLTVPNTEKIRDFYQHVVGWEVVAQPMGGYDDYSMIRKNEPNQPIAGICHPRGTNSNLPPVWLVYLPVEDLALSLKHCAEQGGTIVSGPVSFGDTARYAVIQDPSGAYVALFCKTDSKAA